MTAQQAPQKKPIDTAYTILLATYNGERYITEFLESCPWSSCADLLIRDDGSSDNTVEVIKQFVGEKDISATFMCGERLGAKNNFGELLKYLEKPYFFFADQDDIWEKDKVPTMLKALQQLEKEYGKDMPLLVYSDASLINAHGSFLHNSFYQKSFIPKKWNEDFKNMLVMPHVPGCTMLGNKALAQAATPIAAEAVMHDAWVLQVAGALGKVCEIENPLIRYRQHDANVLGARTWRTIAQRCLKGVRPKHESIVNSQRQAGALLKHCGDMMPQEKYELCKTWAEVTEKGWLARRLVYGRHGFRKAGWLHNAVLWTCG